MYEGIMSEAGKRVSEQDAFSYACERIETGTEEEKNTFMCMAKGAEGFDDFHEDLIEWYFSGEWVKGY